MTFMTEKLAFGATFLILLVQPNDVLAGRGGGMQRGGSGMQRGGSGMQRGGSGMQRGGGGMQRGGSGMQHGGGGMQRGGSGMQHGGGMGQRPSSHSPSFSSPRQSMNQGGRQGGQRGTVNQAGIGNRPETGGNQAGIGNRAGIVGNQTGFENRSAIGNQTELNNRRSVGNQAELGNRNLSNVSAAETNNARIGQTNLGNQIGGNNTFNTFAASNPNVGQGYRNQYNQYHPNVTNGYWHGNNAAGWGLATGVGLGAAGYNRWVGAWGTGSPMYAWGYSSYSNPYYYSGGSGGVPQQQSQAPAYNYSQPISTTATPPEPSVTDQAALNFNQARDAFKAGDYAKALKLDNQALTQMPNDATLHEFLGLVLFAQGQYDQAAAPLYAVLSVGPGWDWTTLSGMYPDVATYTKQVRALETYIKNNPKSAQARFVLSYHYITQGHNQDAVSELQQVVKLQPSDTLSAQLIAQLQPPGTSAPSAEPAEPSAPVKDGMLSGNWTASPTRDAKITLAIQGDGGFTWTASTPGQPSTTITGDSALSEDVLTLTGKDKQQGALVGRVAWQDDNHFTFQLVGGPPGDPGLKFAR